jgi:hypothetical protein
MSTISSFSSIVSRDSYAESVEAIDGAKQAFREADRKTGNNDYENDDSEAAFPAEAVEDEIASSAAGNNAHILNVTA